MGDSTTMTIEFLRARLLSERSVSRTARQRADQLAKRVVELEEQLRIMIIQRKKAEKAATEVLTILENQGEGYFAEVIDSSSDQDDVDGETKRSDVKEDETSNASRVEKSEVEDGLSGSEPETSPSQGRSLSWKGRSSSPDSHEKQIRQRQRRSSFTSATESSGKHQLGKSCRKIRQSEMRSAAEDELPKPTLDEHGKKEATLSNMSNEQPEFLRKASSHEMEEVFPYTSVACSLDDQIKETDASLYANKGDKDEEMERVLEQQAQLIGQYQAEENAQREWEEKYNETKSSTSDSCEPGSQSDTTKTCSEAQEVATKLAGKNTYYAEEAKSRAEDIPNKEEPTAQSLSNVSVPTIQTPHAIDPEKSGSSNKVTAMGLSNASVLPVLTRIGGSSSPACSDGVLVQQYNGMVVQDAETSSQEFAFPAQEHWNMSTNGKQDHGLLYGNIDTGSPSNTGSHSNSSIHPQGNGIPERTSSGSPSSVNSSGKFSRWQSPEMRNQLQRLLPQSPSGRLEGVLQALQRAKTSLGQLSGLPLPNQGTLVTVAPTDSRDRTIKYGGDLDIPIGPTGLFRLPTDSYPQASFSMPKFHGSGLSLTSTYPDFKYAITSSEYQYPSATYVENGSRISVGRHHFDPYITSGTGIPASTRHSLPYSHLTTERNPSRDGISNSGMYLRNEMPAGDRYSLYGGDGALSDMQRL